MGSVWVESNAHSKRKQQRTLPPGRTYDLAIGRLFVEINAPDMCKQCFCVHARIARFA